MIHEVLEPKVKAQGVKILTSAKLVNVELKDHHIVQTKIQRYGSSDIQTINTPNVILATGGYLNNPLLMNMDSHYPKNRIIPVNSGKNTGDGLQIAWHAGAQKYRMGTSMLFGGYVIDHQKPSFVYRYSELNGAATQEALLWVNGNGDRFVNEEVSNNFAFAGNTLLTQKRTLAIADQNDIDRLSNKLYKPFGTFPYLDNKLPNLKKELDKAINGHAEFLYQADSISELGKKAKLLNLNKTVNRYNFLAQQHKDADFGKKAAFLHLLVKAPFYAFDLGVGAFCTMGGLKVDLHNLVLDENDKAIDGLFAIGNDGTANIAGDTYGITLPGTEAGYVIYSARNAADYIADNVQERDE